MITIPTLQFGNPDPAACPTTLTQLVTMLNALAQAQTITNFAPYILSQNTPAVDDQDKLWYRLDNLGRPIGLFVFYSGVWRRQYSGLLGEVKYYSGDPATDFDAAGLGNVGGTWDGWHLANGAGGTMNLSNGFIVGANMDSLGGGGQYSSGWQTFVDGALKKTGGSKDHTIVMHELPNMRVRVTGFAAQANGNNSPAEPIIDDDYNQSKPRSKTIANFGADPIPENPETTPTPQLAMATVPPFYALAVVQFVGY